MNEFSHIKLDAMKFYFNIKLAANVKSSIYKIHEYNVYSCILSNVQSRSGTTSIELKFGHFLFNHL